MASYRDSVACVSHKKERRPQSLEIFIGRLFSNISCRLTWIKRKVPLSDVRTTNNIKALNLKGDDFRVDGAFVFLRVPAGEAPRAVPKWRGRYQFMKAGDDPASVAHGKEPTCHAGDMRDAGSIPGSGRSSGEGNAAHCSILTWRIPWMEEPGGLQFRGSQRVGQCD